jgi:hypothetical protein
MSSGIRNETRLLSLMSALRVNSGTMRCVRAVRTKRPLRFLHELPKAQQLQVAAGSALFRCVCRERCD